MTRPLQPGDPTAFGAFTVDSRLADSPAAVVFLGADAEGRRASIAALVGPAAQDPAMRQRFQEVADPGELYAEAGIRVLAADLDGTTPWVATSYDGVRPGAERVIEELAGGDATARYFQPFSQYPAETGYLPTKQGPRAPRRSLWWWAVVGIIILAALLLMLLLLVKCGGSPQPNPTITPTRTVTTTSPSSPSPSRSSASPSKSGSRSQSPSKSRKSPSPSGSRSRLPTPSGTGTNLPTGRPVSYP